MEVSVRLQAPIALIAHKETPVPIGWEAGWGPGTKLDAKKKRKFVFFYQESSYDYSVVLPAAWSLYLLSYFSM